MLVLAEGFTTEGPTRRAAREKKGPQFTAKNTKMKREGRKGMGRNRLRPTLFLNTKSSKRQSRKRSEVPVAQARGASCSTFGRLNSPQSFGGCVRGSQREGEEKSERAAYIFRDSSAKDAKRLRRIFHLSWRGKSSRTLRTFLRVVIRRARRNPVWNDPHHPGAVSESSRGYSEPQALSLPKVARATPPDRGFANAPRRGCWSEPRPLQSHCDHLD